MMQITIRLLLSETPFESVIGTYNYMEQKEYVLFYFTQYFGINPVKRSLPKPTEVYLNYGRVLMRDLRHVISLHVT